MRQSILEKDENLVMHQENFLLTNLIDEKDRQIFFGEPYYNQMRRQELDLIADPTSIRNQILVLAKSESDCVSILKNFIISPTNGYKTTWDLIILFLVVYTCFSSAFQAAFNDNLNKPQYKSYEIVIDLVFGVDIILNFFTSFPNPDNTELVKDIRVISKKYLKGYFLFDFLATFPFSLLTVSVQANGLLRFVRLPRLFKVLDQNQVMRILNQAIQHFDNQYKVLIQFTVLYIYRIIRFIIVGVSLTFFIACIWFLIVQNILDHQNEKEINFVEYYQFNQMNLERQFIVNFYFTISTLATVGYGDFVPQRSHQRIITIFIMIGGIAFFSYIMHNFNDIITNFHEKMGYTDKTGELELWILELSNQNMISYLKFKQLYFHLSPLKDKQTNKHLSKELVRRIFDDYEYASQFHRIPRECRESKYFIKIPQVSKNKVLIKFNKKMYQSRYSFLDFIKMIRHLFQDIFHQTFQNLFLVNAKKQYHDFNFYIEMALAMVPRRFSAGQHICRVGEKYKEIYLLTNGQVKMSTVFLGQSIDRFYDKGFSFGLINVFSNSPSHFDYSASSKVHMMAIEKQTFLDILNRYPDMKLNILTASQNNFQNTQKYMLVLMKSQYKNQKLESPDVRINDKISLQEIYQMYIDDIKQKNPNFNMGEFQLQIEEDKAENKEQNSNLMNCLADVDLTLKLLQDNYPDAIERFMMRQNRFSLQRSLENQL